MAFDLSTARPAGDYPPQGGGMVGGFDLSTAKPAGQTSYQSAPGTLNLSELERQNGLPSGILSAVMQKESGGNPNEVPPKGAVGLFQFMPATAKQYGIDPRDPQQSAQAAAKMLGELNRKYNGDIEKALAGYNWGQGNVDLIGMKKAPAETRKYIAAVTGAIKPTLQFGPWDTGVEISPEWEAGLARAGAATLDAANGVKGLVGMGDSPEEVAGRKEVIGKLEEEYPISSGIGNIVANAGMMYAGGSGLKALGSVAKISQSAPNVAAALTRGGQILQAPSSAKDAVIAGAGYGAVTDAENRAAGAVGGAAGGAVGYGIGKALGTGAEYVGNKVAGLVRRMKPPTMAEIDDLIVRRLGVDAQQYLSLPDAGKEALRKMAKDALDNGGTVTPEMAQRLADFQTAGIERPLKGWVTREPKQWVEAHNLQGVEPEITTRYNEASNALVQKMQGLAPERSDYYLGSKFERQIAGKDAELKHGVDAAYDAFRGMGGRDVPLDAARFNNEVALELDQKMAGGRLPNSVIKWFRNISTGAEPFTFGTAAQRLENLNTLMRHTDNDAEKYALRIVKRHLENALTGFGEEAGAAGATGTQAMADAFKNARGIAKNRFEYLESSPLHKMVTDGKFKPENLPDMIKSITVNDLKAMAEADAKYGTTSVADLKDAAAAYIRDSATLHGETGGKYSQAGLRRAMDRIGPENGAVLFGPVWGELQAVLRAGGSMMNQPAGVIANNSGTGQMIAMMLRSAPGVGRVLGAGADLAIKGIQAAKRAGAVNDQLGGVRYVPRSLWEMYRIDPAGASARLGSLVGTPSGVSMAEEVGSR